MPQVYLSKSLYDQIVVLGYDVGEFVEDCVKEKLLNVEKSLKKKKKEEKNG